MKRVYIKYRLNVTKHCCKLSNKTVDILLGERLAERGLSRRPIGDEKKKTRERRLTLTPIIQYNTIQYNTIQ